MCRQRVNMYTDLWTRMERAIRVNFYNCQLIAARDSKETQSDHRPRIFGVL